MAAITELWERVWFAPATGRSLIATRSVIALHALWIILSRPDIPELPAWPHVFLAYVPRTEFIRFAFGAPVAIEWILYAILHIALLAAALNLLPRASSLAAGLLIYHFAPFEELIAGMPHTFFGGLTLPCLGLLILSFAPAPREARAASPDFRWPVALIQLLFAFNYFFAWIAKMRFAHLHWFTAANIRRWAIENWAMTAAAPPPLAFHVADHAAFCWMFAIGTFVLELFFPLVVISRWARRILVPMALLGHVGIVYTLNINFPSLPLLLLYVNWDWVAARRRVLSHATDAQHRADREAARVDERRDQPAST